MVVFLIVLQGLSSRPRISQVTPYYQENAKILTGAKDVVGAIIVDFRGLDTLVEISVFAIAGLAVYTLLRWEGQRSQKELKKKDRSTLPALDSQVHGVGGGDTSPFIHALAYISLPLAMLIAITHLMYGHDQPGDGFTAGVIIGLAIGFWYVVFGYRAVRQRLSWLRPIPLIASGLLIAVVNRAITFTLIGSFLGPLDYGQRLGFAPIRGFNLSTAFFFELAIGLTVLGSIVLILEALGSLGGQASQEPGRIEEVPQYLSAREATQAPDEKEVNYIGNPEKEGVGTSEQSNKLSDSR